MGSRDRFETIEAAESCILWLRQFSDVHPSFARVSAWVASVAVLTIEPIRLLSKLFLVKIPKFFNTLSI